MITDKYINQYKEGNFEILEAENLYNTNKAYLLFKNLKRHSLFSDDVNKVIGYFLQTKAPTAYLSILTRIREDDTITQRIVLGRVSDFNLEEFTSKFNQRKPILGIEAVYTNNRCHITPHIDIIYDKGMLILLYNDTKVGVFSEVISDKEAYINIKSKMWGLASICAKDIKHSNICFENDGRINIEVKSTSFNEDNLSNILATDKHIYTWQDIPIKVTPHRLIYNYK